MAKLARLQAMFASMRFFIVAFSGGVDSTFVLKVAQETAGARVLALTTTSPTMPDEDLASAKELAGLIGARHLIIGSNELEIPGYAENPLNRCYLCKHNLFTVCEAKAGELGIANIVDGLNLDDLNDYRPGMQAAVRKAGASSAGRSRADQGRSARTIREMGLPTWDRPASPCLSSRFPYGTEITPDGLEQVAAGEKLLHSLGFRDRSRTLPWRGRAAGSRARRDRAVFEPAIGETSIASSRSSAFASSRLIWAASAPAR